MNRQPSDKGDALDTLLSELVEHTPDGGFTRRVLTALPARRHQRHYRFGILTSAAVLCGITLFWLVKSSEWFSIQYAEIGPTTLGYILAVILGASATAWGLWELVTDNDRR